MAAAVEEIDVAQLADWMREEDVLLIDVRESTEYQPEHIVGAHNICTSTFDPSAVPDPEGRRVVFYCQAGVRSYNAARRWSDMVEGSECPYSLAGGIAAWKEMSLPTKVDHAAAADVQRQTYGTIGACVLAGSLLTAWVSPYFVWLTGAVGAGLLYTAWRGSCTLSILISKLPWNRQK